MKEEGLLIATEYFYRPIQGNMPYMAVKFYAYENIAMLKDNDTLKQMVQWYKEDNPPGNFVYNTIYADSLFMSAKNLFGLDIPWPAFYDNYGLFRSLTKKPDSRTVLYLKEKRETGIGCLISSLFEAKKTINIHGFIFETELVREGNDSFRKILDFNFKSFQRPIPEGLRREIYDSDWYYRHMVSGSEPALLKAGRDLK